MKQNCYKNTKSPRQIRRYIRRQAWYYSFKELVMMEWDRPIWERLMTLWGFDGAATIINAFDWDNTVQGRKHWEIVNECFTEWFVGDKINS